jgi:membrane protein
MEKINSFIKRNINKNFFIFIDKLLYRIQDHRVMELAASLVYFAILSIFPFIIALLNFLNFTSFLKSDQLTTYINYLPKDISNIAIKFIAEISANSSSGLFSISIIAGLYTASNVVHKLIKNINLAYGFKDDRGYVKLRGMALLFTIALIIIVVFVLLTQILSEYMTRLILDYLGLQIEINTFVKVSFISATIFVLFLIISLLYKLSPVKTARDLISYKMVLPGSAFATVTGIIASKIFAFYVKYFGKYSLTYGSLGGIIVMLIWMWMIFIIIIVGAEINGTIFSMKNFKNSSIWPRYDSIIKNRFDQL